MSRSSSKRGRAKTKTEKEVCKPFWYFKVAMKRNRTGLIPKPLGVSGAPGKGMWASGGTDTLPGPAYVSATDTLPGPACVSATEAAESEQRTREESTEEPGKEQPERVPDSQTAG